MSEITKALVAFQKAVENPLKDAENPHFRSKYVNLDGIIKAIKEPLNNNGLSFNQIFEDRDGVNYLVTRLWHVNGESIESALPIQPDKSNIQGFGAAVTYLRRYSLECICGITGDDDDDGETAVETKQNVTNKNNSPKATPKQVNFLKSLLKEKYPEGAPENILNALPNLSIGGAKEKIEKLKKDLGKV